MTQNEGILDPEAKEAAREAEGLLRRSSYGVLGTLSKRFDGWPFGSVTPYAVSRRGRPILLIASIAEHTKNLAADDRASLLVHQEGKGDVQARGRLTILGRARAVPENELLDARARYLARLPSAADYARTHDFSFVELVTERVRFIGGFGRIFWLEASLFGDPEKEDPLITSAAGILEHMNQDHHEAMLLYCRAFKGLSPQKVEMVGVDRYGFDLAVEGSRERFDFDQPADPANIRERMVELVKKARAELKEPRGSAPAPH